MFKRDGITYVCPFEYQLMNKIEYDIEHPKHHKKHHRQIYPKKHKRLKKPKIEVWKKE